MTRTQPLTGLVVAGMLLAGTLVAGCDGPATPAGGPAPATSAGGPAPATSPAGPVPAGREALLGRWEPATGAQTAVGRAFVELHDDGRWTGSDGCNAEHGRWAVAADGMLRADAGPSTEIGCANVPVALWLTGARTARLSGDTLVLLDERGAETGRLRRVG